MGNAPVVIGSQKDLIETQNIINLKKTISDARLAAIDARAAAAEARAIAETKEPIIVPGTSDKYWRGDKTFQVLNGAAIVNTPAGNLSGTDMQAVVNELDTEKQSITSINATIASVLLCYEGDVLTYENEVLYA